MVQTTNHTSQVLGDLERLCIYIYMCVCIYIHICVYIYMYIYVCVFVYIFILHKVIMQIAYAPCITCNFSKKSRMCNMCFS